MEKFAGAASVCAVLAIGIAVGSVAGNEDVRAAIEQTNTALLAAMA